MLAGPPDLSYLFSILTCLLLILLASVQLFFAKVLRSASEEEVRQLFGQFGRVVEVNLFRAFQVGDKAIITVSAVGAVDCVFQQALL